MLDNNVTLLSHNALPYFDSKLSYAGYRNQAWSLADKLRIMQWFLSVSALSFHHILLGLLRRACLQFALGLIKTMEGLLPWWHGAVFRIPSWNSPALVSRWSSSPNAIHCTLSIKSEWLTRKPSDPPEPPRHWRFVEISWCLHLNPRGTSHSLSFLYAFPWFDWPWVLISIYPLLFSHLLATEKSRLLSVTQITLTPLTDIHLWEVQKRLKKAQVVFFF